MQGVGSSGRSAGGGDGERRARGFQLGQHGGGSSGRTTGDGDAERRARGFQLGQHGGGSSGWTAGDGDGERRAGRFQLGEPTGGTSGRSAGNRDGGRQTLAFQLGRPRGSTSASTSASVWTTSASTDGGKRSAPWDISERPGSTRQDAAYLTSLMVARFVEMGFPTEKGSSQHSAASLTSPMVARFMEMGFSTEKVAMALKHSGGGRDEEAAILQWLLDREQTGFSSSSDFEGLSSSSDDLEVFSSSTDLEAELTESDKFFKLVEMGFTTDEASSAIAICGRSAPVSVLADAVYAAQFDRIGSGSGEHVVDSQRKRRGCSKKLSGHLQKSFGNRPMVGFGVPDVEMNMNIPSRKLPAGIAAEPPYFYF